MLDKNKLIHAMSERMKALQHMTDRDFSGNTQATLEAWREVKYWKEAIERNEFRPKLMEDYE